MEGNRVTPQAEMEVTNAIVRDMLGRLTLADVNKIRDAIHAERMAWIDCGSWRVELVMKSLAEATQ